MFDMHSRVSSDGWRRVPACMKCPDTTQRSSMPQSKGIFPSGTFETHLNCLAPGDIKSQRTSMPRGAEACCPRAPAPPSAQCEAFFLLSPSSFSLYIHPEFLSIVCPFF